MTLYVLTSTVVLKQLIIVKPVHMINATLANVHICTNTAVISTQEISLKEISGYQGTSKP